jgi:[ribosomal protein S5]-alanine N-acetyltransferase
MKPLRTARLLLEPQTAVHAEEMFGVLSDPAIYQHENAPPPSLQWLRDRFTKLESRCSRDGREQWLNWVVRNAQGKAIGYVQATVFAGGDARVAYEFASAHWGQGLASEAVRAMLGELRASYGVNRLTAVLKRGNQRSMRLLLRLGFALATQQQQREAAIEADECLMWLWGLGMR